MRSATVRHRQVAKAGLKKGCSQNLAGEAAMMGHEKIARRQ